MNKGKTCKTCRFCWKDERSSVYRRGEIWFCKKKTLFFSRNYRPGENGRILPQQEACLEYQALEGSLNNLQKGGRLE